jgi:hypothetical protein
MEGGENSSRAGGSISSLSVEDRISDKQCVRLILDFLVNRFHRDFGYLPSP